MYRSLFIANIFKIINLVLIVFVIAYVFKKYVLDTIKAQMLEEILKTHNLEQDIISNKKQVSSIKLEIEKQEKDNKIILKKIKQWADAVSQENKKLELFLDSNLVKAQERVVVQQKNLEEDVVKKRAVPLVIEQLKNIAYNKFNNKTEQEKFSEDVINYLKGKD